MTFQYDIIVWSHFYLWRSTVCINSLGNLINNWIDGSISFYQRHHKCINNSEIKLPIFTWKTIFNTHFDWLILLITLTDCQPGQYWTFDSHFLVIGISLNIILIISTTWCPICDSLRWLLESTCKWKKKLIE